MNGYGRSKEGLPGPGDGSSLFRIRIIRPNILCFPPEAGRQKDSTKIALQSNDKEPISCLINLDGMSGRSRLKRKLCLLEEVTDHRPEIVRCKTGLAMGDHVRGEAAKNLIHVLM